MKAEEATKSIIGSGMGVLNSLRPGLDEKLYEKALEIELLRRGHKVDRQKVYAVQYRGQKLEN